MLDRQLCMAGKSECLPKPDAVALEKKFFSEI